MSVKSKHHRGCIVVCLSGELDLKTAGELKATVDPALLGAKTPPTVVLDLSGVNFMDSSGMGAILGRYRTVSQMGGKLAVCSLTPQLRKFLSDRPDAHNPRFRVAGGCSCRPAGGRIGA